MDFFTGVKLFFDRVVLNKKFYPLENNYELIFQDSFKGGIDWNKWSWREPWSYNEDTHKRNTIWRKECVINTADGISLKADRQKELNKNACGLISSHKFLNILYCYVEVEAKMPPHGYQYFPAIWMYNRNGWLPEIDIVELMGEESTSASFTHHWLDSTNNHKQKGKSFNLHMNLNDKYHIFSMEWTPQSITWFIDGYAYYKRISNIPNVPLFLICNIQAGGNPPFSHIFTENEVPKYMDIKSVKVYQKDKD